MGVLVFVLGRSGTGKSYSMRGFGKDELALINVQGKVLPFRNWQNINIISTDNSAEICEALETLANNYKSIVIDDFQYLMANEFMRRSTEKGYDKFTEIGRHAWDVPNKVASLPDDVIVYIMCHTDRDDEGHEKIKTIGKLLDEKICLEGMSTIVLKTNVCDGQYTFLTQNNGKDTVKSPFKMFPSYAIDNDLKYVDDKIRNYYGFDGAKTDDEIQKADEQVKTDIEPDKPKKSRRTARAEKQTEELVKDFPKEGEDEKVPVDEDLNPLPERKERETPAPVEEPVAEEKPRRRRRRTE